MSIDNSETEIPNKKSITFEVIKYVSISYFTIALLLTFVQIVYEYSIIKEKIDIYVEDIQITFTGSITNSIWEFNDLQTESIIQGIVKSPSVTKVQIYSAENKLLFKSAENFKSQSLLTYFVPTKEFSYKTPLIKELDNGEKELIGNLIIYSNTHVIAEQLSSLIYYIIFNSIIKTIVLWIILIVFLNRKLRLPLLDITESLSKVDPKKPKVISIKNKDNIIEFNLIQKSFNNVIIQLNNYKDVLEAIVENKTELLKEKNVEVQELISNLEMAQERIIQQEKLSTLGIMSAGISHELKNPLNLSINTTIMIQDLIHELKVEESEYKEIDDLLEIVLNNNKKMSTIINSMLMQSRSYNDPKQDINVFELIETNYLVLLKSLQNNEEVPEINFKNEIPKDFTMPIFVNDFGRMVVNLFENSIHSIATKYKINRFNPEIKVYLKETNNNYELCFYDNGLGVKEELKRKITQPFFTTKSFGKGTGLGLYLSNQIIEKHDGEIEIHSNYEEYVEFIIRFPKVK